MDPASDEATFARNSDTLIRLTSLVKRMAHRERVDNTVPLANHAATRDIDVRAEASTRLLRRKGPFSMQLPHRPPNPTPPPAA